MSPSPLPGRFSTRALCSRPVHSAYSEEHHCWEYEEVGGVLKHKLVTFVLVKRGREHGGAEHRDRPVAVTRRGGGCVNSRWQLIVVHL